MSIRHTIFTDDLPGGGLPGQVLTSQGPNVLATWTAGGSGSVLSVTTTNGLSTTGTAQNPVVGLTNYQSNAAVTDLGNAVGPFASRAYTFGLVQEDNQTTLTFYSINTAGNSNASLITFTGTLGASYRPNQTAMPNVHAYVAGIASGNASAGVVQVNANGVVQIGLGPDGTVNFPSSTSNQGFHTFTVSYMN